MQIGYGQTQKIEVRYDNSASPGQDCALHPLIYTFSSSKNTTTCGAGQKAQKFELKYDI
jgi:hypothetical protein